MREKSEQGFSYIDVMIAIVILLVGVLALLSAITGAVLQSKGQERQLGAKQIATTTMESVMAVKENKKTNDGSVQLGWSNVGNVGNNIENGVAQGIFVNGFQPVTVGAGPDSIIGTADDDGDVIAGFERRIVITDECDPERPSPAPVCATPGDFAVRMRSVVVTVNYFVGTIQRQEQMRTVLTDYYIAD